MHIAAAVEANSKLLPHLHGLHEALVQKVTALKDVAGNPSACKKLESVWCINCNDDEFSCLTVGRLQVASLK